MFGSAAISELPLGTPPKDDSGVIRVVGCAAVEVTAAATGSRMVSASAAAQAVGVAVGAGSVVFRYTNAPGRATALACAAGRGRVEAQVVRHAEAHGCVTAFGLGRLDIGVVVAKQSTEPLPLITTTTEVLSQTSHHLAPALEDAEVTTSVIPLIVSVSTSVMPDLHATSAVTDD